MSLSLLSLPREIRDEIYSYLLVAPDGIVEPNLKSFQQRTYHLRQLFASLSIMRVCRQTYVDMHQRFWDQTFFFATFGGPRNAPGPTHIFNIMGQSLCRLITSICILVNPVIPGDVLPQVLQQLISCAHHGRLRKVELSWCSSSFSQLFMAYAVRRPPGLGGPYNNLLEILATAAEACHCERILRFTFAHMQSRTRLRTLIEEMGLTFQAKVFVRDICVWQNEKLVEGMDAVIHPRHVRKSV